MSVFFSFYINFKELTEFKPLFEKVNFLSIGIAGSASIYGVLCAGSYTYAVLLLLDW